MGIKEGFTERAAFEGKKATRIWKGTMGKQTLQYTGKHFSVNGSMIIRE